MGVTIILPVDSTGFKRKVKSNFLAVDADNKLMNGSVLIKYVDSITEQNLPEGGNVAEKRVKQEVELMIGDVINKYIDPPALVYVDSTVVPTAKRVGDWVMGRKQAQLTDVPVDPDGKDMLDGVVKKLVEIMQTNGEL